MIDSTQVLAHFENREVRPIAFKHNDIKYSIKEILQTKEADNPFLTMSGIRDRKYWVVTQNGTRTVLHWHRDTGEWTIEKIIIA